LVDMAVESGGVADLLVIAGSLLGHRNPV